MLALEIPSVKPLTDPSIERSAEDLKSLLIVGFETAIDEGLPPQRALSIVLEWVAGECARATHAAPASLSVIR